MAGFNSFFPQDENVTDGIVPVAGTGDIFVDSPISVDTAIAATTFAFVGVNITQVGTVATIVPSPDLPTTDFGLARVGDVLTGITGGREFIFTAVSLTSITATRTAGGTGTINNDGGTITRTASGSDVVTVSSGLTVTGETSLPNGLTVNTGGNINTVNSLNITGAFGVNFNDGTNSNGDVQQSGFNVNSTGNASIGGNFSSFSGSGRTTVGRSSSSTRVAGENVTNPASGTTALGIDSNGALTTTVGGGGPASGTILLPSPDVVDHSMSPVLTTNSSITLHPTINMLGNFDSVELSAFYLVGTTNDLSNIVSNGTQTTVQTLAMPSTGVQATILIDSLPRATEYSILIVVAFPGGYYVSEVEQISTTADTSPSASITVSLDGGAEATANQTPEEATALVFTLTAVDNEGDDFTQQWQQELSVTVTAMGDAAIGLTSISFDDPTDVAADSLTGATFTSGTTTHTVSGNTGNTVEFTPALATAVSDDDELTIVQTGYINIEGETGTTYTIASLSRGLNSGRFRAVVTPGSDSSASAVNSNDIGIAVTATTAFGRASISRSATVAFAGSPDNPGDANIQRFYPYDYTAGNPVQGSTAWAWVVKPGDDTTLNINGTADVRQTQPALAPRPVAFPALTHGFAGVVGYQVTLPNSGPGCYSIGEFPGLPTNVSRTYCHSNIANGRTLELNVSLTGITQWAGNGFYSPPDITSLSTLVQIPGQLAVAGFYVGAVAATADVRYEATRNMAGTDITYADETTNHLGVYVSNPIPSWGLSWVQILLDGSFYGNPDTIGGTGAIDIDIRVV